MNTNTLRIQNLCKVTVEQIRKAVEICGVAVVSNALQKQQKVKGLRDEMHELGMQKLTKSSMLDGAEQPWYMQNRTARKAFDFALSRGTNQNKKFKSCRIKGNQDRIDDLLALAACALTVDDIANYTGLSVPAVTQICWPVPAGNRATIEAPVTTAAAHVAPEGFKTVEAHTSQHAKDVADHIAQSCLESGVDLKEVIAALVMRS